MSLNAEERLAIFELLSRAAYAYDQRDLPGLAECFTLDACFSMRIAQAEPIAPFAGREAIMALYRDAMAAQTDVRRHVISNPFFTETGDQPTVVSNLTLLATEDGHSRLLCTGVYRDTLHRIDSRWRLYRRHLDLDSAY